MKCQDNMYKTKKAPQKGSKLPKKLDFSKMKLAENPDEVAATYQQTRKPKRGQRTATNRAKKK